MDSKKNIVDLEAFREMLHISPRIPGQSFDELPFKEEILDFLRFLGHSAQIKTLTDVNVNKLFQPWRSFAAVINKCLTGKSFGFDSFREAAPKPKASTRRKRDGFDSSTTPPTAVASPRPITTVVAAPRLTAAAKGKQPARATNEGTGSKPGVPDVPSDDSEKEILWNSFDDKDEEIAKLDEQEDTESGEDDAEETESDEESAKEETREEEEESFNPIPITPEDSGDDGNGEEDQGLKVSEEQRLIEEEEADELYRDVDINQGRG
nr:hypothetical protein [Tanacetum cinerariifolium]